MALVLFRFIANHLVSLVSPQPRQTRESRRTRIIPHERVLDEAQKEELALGLFIPTNKSTANWFSLNDEDVTYAWGIQGNDRLPDIDGYDRDIEIKLIFHTNNQAIAEELLEQHESNLLSTHYVLGINDITESNSSWQFLEDIPAWQTNSSQRFSTEHGFIEVEQIACLPGFERHEEVLAKDLLKLRRELLCLNSYFLSRLGRPALII